MEVRRLAAEDAALACRVVRDVKLRASPFDCPLPPMALTAWLSRDANVLVAASAAARPLGFALGYFLDRIDGEDRMLFFYEIEVLESERRRGVGRRLVEEMKRVAQQEGARRLWVETAPDNAAACALYASAGGRRAEAVSMLFVWSEDDLAGGKGAGGGSTKRTSGEAKPLHSSGTGWC